jgi:hypothetical protein
MEFNKKRFFQKISKNLFCYVIEFINFHEYKELMLVSSRFVEVVRYFIQNEIDKNKKLFQFYKKHIFLFNSEISNLIQKVILPHVKDNLGLRDLVKNKSLCVKNFLRDIEKIILGDTNIYNSNRYEKIFFENLRKDFITYIARRTVKNFNKIFELNFKKLEIGQEGAELISKIIRFSKEINYLDLSNSKITPEEMKVILGPIEKINGYFSLNLEGIELDLNVLKIITKIKNEDYQKEIYLSDVNKKTINASKVTRPKYIKFK